MRFGARLGQKFKSDGLQKPGLLHRLSELKKTKLIRRSAEFLPPAGDPMRELLRDLRSREHDMLRLLGKFVRSESPSQDKAALDLFGGIVAAEWRKRVARTVILKQPKRGNHIRAEVWLGEGSPEGQIMVLGHLDTVYPLGTLARMPFRLSRGRGWGPGTFDMKGGLVLALAAVDALRAHAIHKRWRPRKRFVFFWSSDEEIGSETSRKMIEDEARRSDVVLVLEPALGPQGRLKTARKGVGTAEIIITGRAAHAGLNPEQGVNAIHEAALQIEKLMRMNHPSRGVTVQATVISGGTTSNVVPASARIEVDLRYTKLSDALTVEKKLRALRPMLKGARVEVRGGLNRPPLERTANIGQLFEQAQELSRRIGISLGEASVGGGSDGNFTAAVGVPTLDGLGAIGDGAHSPHEHILIRALAPRAALLAGLLITL